MMQNNVSYDPSAIQKFAARLYAKANSIITTSVFGSFIVGIFVGGIFGVLAPKFLQFHLEPMLSALIFGVIGAFHGYSNGVEKAYRFKLEAQLALCQVQIEKNTASKS